MLCPQCYFNAEEDSDRREKENDLCLRQCPAETRHKVRVLSDPYSVAHIASSYFPEWIIRNAFEFGRR